MNGIGPYFCKRLLLACVTFFVIMLVTYVLLRLAPGDPTRTSVFGDGSGSSQVLSSEKNALGVNEVLRKQLHYDKDPVTAFCLWFRDILRGDWGVSVSVDKGQKVLRLILDRLPVTLKLNVISLFLVLILSVPLGIFSGVHPDTFSDKAITFILFFLYSLPMLWTALMLQALLCKGGFYPVFPLKGLEPEIVRGMSTWAILREEAMHCFLPVFCMSYAGIAGLSRYTRNAMIEVMHEDFIRTARAKGVSEGVLVFHHAFRNTLIVMATLMAGLLPGLIGGSLIIEYVFSIPGMGALSMTALESRDVPLVMALFAISGILTLLGMLLSDLLYVMADPRITFRGRM